MNELDSILQQLQARTAGRQQSMAEIFSEALGSVDSMQAPANQPVPQAAGPFGSMASVFAASLADQLGARGAMQANAQRLAQQKEDQLAVEHSNFARQQAFDHDKQMQRIGVLLKIGEAKLEVLKDQGDVDKYEAQVKANASLADKARKAQQDFEEKMAGINHQNRLAEILAGKKKTAEEIKQTAEDKEDKLILKFQEDIANVAKKPGNTAKNPAHKVSSIEWIFGGKDTPETVDLTATGVDAILSRSAATVRSAGGERLQRAALETYYETAKNAGRLKAGSPEYAKLVTLLNFVFKNPADMQAWVEGHR